MKFDRKCQLKVEINPTPGPNNSLQGSQTLTIPKNLVIEFEVSRRALASSQEATFRVLNLEPRTRDLLQKDPYAFTEFRAIQFRAGYADFPIPLVFNGFVRSATSFRRGEDSVTEITAYDGGLAMANGWTAQTIAQGTPLSQVLRNLAANLPHVPGQPIVGDFPGTNLRGKVLFGNTWSIILQESGNLATIDNGQVKILQANEAIEAPLPLITSDSGLLGTPRRTPTMVEFSMLLEPRLTIGQIIQLDSAFNKLLNGTYKVVGFSHRGAAPSTGDDPAASVTPTIAGDYQSAVSLFFGPDELKVVRGNLVQ